MRAWGRGFVAGLALAAVCAPAAIAAPSFIPPGKAFGFNADVYPADQPAGSPRTIDAATAAGADYMRMGINWRNYQVETSVTKPIPPSFSVPKGQPTGSNETDRVDKLYLEYQARGIKPILMIHNAPDWASTFHDCLENPVVALDSARCPKDWRSKTFVFYTDPDRQDALRAFVSAVVRRYPAAIIEGTNEPDFQREFQPQYHPPLWKIASAQCALANAVKVTDPDRKVLSPGFYFVKYVREFMSYIGPNHSCWDTLSFHLFGSTEVRAGFGSGAEAQLEELRSVIGQGARIFITETGLSNTVQFNDANFNEKAEKTGEALVSRAWPRWIRYFADQPDIDGVLVHTVRQEVPADTGDLNGFGLLNPDFSVKQPGGGIIPRFCFLSISAGKSYPGCEGQTVPGDPAPAAPTFYKAPLLLFSRTDTTVGKTTRVMFLEEGGPLPEVKIEWQRCNAAGLACQTVLQNRSVYTVQPADRFNRLKVVVSLSNQYGSTSAATTLSPIITG